ncbi:DUF808 domain-containing protein [Thiomicrorhabdus sp.]|uniref:DUF808 domain-containing protein n=1 Tax=Thiomicrorhabdus sp. TaxID=2039724 RepID=UPI003567CF3B
MASGIFVILDDIATLFDDAATMTKVAAKKTAGVLGDDLAVGAEKASGFKASRELPVLWAITKGSFKNKLIILPVAFLLSAFAPWLIVPILLLGGIYLSFEGAEKIYEFLFHKTSESKPVAETEESKAAILEEEKRKIKSAILMDFILSIEIVILALSAVAEQTLPIQIVAVTVVAFLATVGVYGIVALLVRMDDAGLYLMEVAENLKGFKRTLTEKTGRGLVLALPKVIRLLSIVGTLAMLLVGGGIFVHNLDSVHHAVDFMPTIIAELLIGLVVGVIALVIEKFVHAVFAKKTE